MRLRLPCVVTILLFARFGNCRPQDLTPLERDRSKTEGNRWKPIQVRSEDVSHAILNNSRLWTSDSQRALKNLQHMDQSLRTVATQLLKVTSSEEVIKTKERYQVDNALTKLIFVEPPIKENEDTQDSSTIVRTIEPLNFEPNSSKIPSNERTVNSKFGYLENSHPGQAVAVTEEELRQELDLIRHKNKVQPTTTSGISTWILLNPPSSTTDHSPKPTTSVVNTEANYQNQSTLPFEKESTHPPQSSFFTATRKPVVQTTSKPEKAAVANSEKLTQHPQEAEKLKLDKKTEKQPTTPKNATLKNSTSSPKINETGSLVLKTTTVKKVRPTPTTAKVKVSQASSNKNSSVAKNSTIKASKPVSQERPKPSEKKGVPKPESHNSNSKIEKVTFKPVQTISSIESTHLETDIPVTITKTKVSAFIETKKTTPLVTMAPKTSVTPFPTSTNSIEEELVEVPFKVKGTDKVNNTQKPQLKKPTEDLTKIEIDPIRVNAPVLKIEKVEEEGKKNLKDSTIKQAQLLNDSRISHNSDLSEMTTVKLETRGKPSSTTIRTSSKRKNSSGKRKKNKNRRRKPTTPVSDVAEMKVSTLSDITELINISPSSNASNDIQELKLEPETRIAINSTKVKKKQVQKPLGSQILNFISRKVMPGFGVMSLVGLGLGLASYFLYPFEGTITRRNYDLEPNYKYDLEEYGGNFGQKEEEVFSKVLQGMTKQKFDGIKEYDDNYYKSQRFNGPYSTTGKKSEQRHSTLSRPIYRPENSYENNYKVTEFKYPELPATPNYYERQKQTNFSVSKEGSGNRQFVVGSIPKDYSSEGRLTPLAVVSERIDHGNVDRQNKYKKGIDSNLNLPKKLMKSPEVYTQSGLVQGGRREDVYEEIEITPTAVPIEHGPRLLRIRRSDPGVKMESVIQVIPSKNEIEKEQKEEEIPLGNEIFNIIESAIPHEEGLRKEKEKRKKEKEKMKENGKTEKVIPEEGSRVSMKDHLENIPKTTLVSGETSTLSSIINHSTSSNLSLKLSTATGEKDLSKTEFSKVEATTSGKRKVEGTTQSGVENLKETTTEWFNDVTTKQPKDPEASGYNIFDIVKKIAEVKIKLGLTILKHASEGFARYLGHVQKRLNGEE